MHYTLFRSFLIVLFAAITFGMSGCGGTPEYNVKGKVTFNGKVVDKPDGLIIFVGPQGQQVDAKINPDGTYNAGRVVMGLNKVAVYYKNPKFTAEMNTRKSKAPPKETIPPYLTPAVYVSPETSGLSIEITKETIYDVDMQGPEVK